MDTPPIILEFYKIIMAIQGWILLPLLVITAIVGLLRGFGMWRKTNGDWSAVFKALESLLTFFAIIAIFSSIFASYDWLRATGLGTNLPDLKSQIEEAKKPKNEE